MERGDLLRVLCCLVDVAGQRQQQLEGLGIIEERRQPKRREAVARQFIGVPATG